MQADTVHTVATGRTAFCIGGHFYSLATMWRTLTGLTKEHGFGGVITNTEHVKMPILLFKLVDYFTQIAEFSGESAFSGESHTLLCRTSNILASSDAVKNRRGIAFLCITVAYMDGLSPLLPEGCSSEQWVGTEEFEADHKYATSAVLVLIALMCHETRAEPKSKQFRSILRTCELQYETFVRALEKELIDVDELDGAAVTPNLYESFDDFPIDLASKSMSWQKKCEQLWAWALQDHDSALRKASKKQKARLTKKRKRV